MTDKKTKAKSKKVPTNNKKPTSKNKIIPNIKQYLIYDFVNCNFENNTLQFTASNAMKSLVSTGEIKHLRTLSTIQSIYREKIFWDQIHNWKILAWDGDSNAELLLETVIRGFRNAIITYKSKRTGRTTKLLPDDIHILESYSKIEHELSKNAIIDFHKQQIDKYQTDLKKGKVVKENKQWAKVIEEMGKNRKKNLVKYLNEKQFKFSDKEIGKMIRKSNSEISIMLLAKRYNVGIRKIKERMAIEDPDYKLIVDFKLPNSTIKTIDYGRFCVERIKAQKESEDIDSYFSILSTKLGVPVESLKTYNYHIHLTQVRTPHKSRVASKTPTKK